MRPECFQVRSSRLLATNGCALMASTCAGVQPRDCLHTGRCRSQQGKRRGEIPQRNQV